MNCCENGNSVIGKLKGSTDMISNTYPFNLIRAIYGDNKTDDTHIETTYIKGLYDMLKTLNKNEQDVLSLRFKDELTLKACGEHISVSSPRIGQIIKQAMRKLRHRKRFNHYEAIPKNERRQFQEEYDHVVHENKKLKQALSKLDNSDIDPQVVILMADMIKPKHLETHIVQLHLSTRSYNALLRADITTIKDVINTPEEKLIHLQNLGEKSIQELKTKIREFIVLPNIYHDQ